MKKNSNLKMIEKQLSEKIQEKIKYGEIKMKPRWFFVLKSFLIISSAIVSFLFAIFLTSFIHFILFVSGAWFLPEFGARGLRFFFFAFPWPIFFAVIIFLVILGLLAKQFSFAYRRPAIFGILGILILALFGSLIFRQILIHDKLFEITDRKNLPIIGAFYENFSKIPPGEAIIGNVLSTTTKGFLIQDDNGSNCAATISAETVFPAGKELELGDTVLVAGSGGCKNLNAMGVRKISNDESPPMFTHRKFLKEKNFPGPPLIENKEKSDNNKILPGE